MSEDDDKPVAEHVSVELGQHIDTKPIEVDGLALLVDGYYQSKISLRIGDQHSTISLTLSPSDARALKKDIDDAIDESRSEVEKWLERDGSNRP